MEKIPSSLEKFSQSFSVSPCRTVTKEMLLTPSYPLALWAVISQWEIPNALGIEVIYSDLQMYGLSGMKYGIFLMQQHSNVLCVVVVWGLVGCFFCLFGFCLGVFCYCSFVCGLF